MRICTLLSLTFGHGLARLSSCHLTFVRTANEMRALRRGSQNAGGGWNNTKWPTLALIPQPPSQSALHPINNLSKLDSRIAHSDVFLVHIMLIIIGRIFHLSQSSILQTESAQQSWPWIFLSLSGAWWYFILLHRATRIYYASKIHLSRPLRMTGAEVQVCLPLSHLYLTNFHVPLIVFLVTMWNRLSTLVILVKLDYSLWWDI